MVWVTPNLWVTGCPPAAFLWLPPPNTTEIFSSHEINMVFPPGGNRDGDLSQKHRQKLRFTTLALPLSTEQKAKQGGEEKRP